MRLCGQFLNSILLCLLSLFVGVLLFLLGSELRVLCKLSLILSGSDLQLLLGLYHYDDEGDDGCKHQNGCTNENQTGHITHSRHEGQNGGEGEEIHLFDLLFGEDDVKHHHKHKQQDHGCGNDAGLVGNVGFLGVDGLIAESLCGEVAALNELKAGGIATDQKNCTGSDGVLAVINGNGITLVKGGIFCTVVAAKRTGGGDVNAFFKLGSAGQVKDALAAVVYGVVAIGGAKGAGLQNNVAVGLVFHLALGALNGNLKQRATHFNCGEINAADRTGLGIGRVNDRNGTGGLHQGSVCRDHVTVQVKGEGAGKIIADGGCQVGLKHNGATLTLSGGSKCLVQGFGLANGLSVSNNSCHNGGIAGACCKPKHGGEGKKRAQHE